MADLFGNTSAGADRFTNRELAEEARREAFLRRRVYPRWVADGRLSQQDADRRIEMMEVIATRLSDLARGAK